MRRGAKPASASLPGSAARSYLLRYDTAYDSLKEIIEGRDEDYATIIQSLVTNMKVSGKLRKTYPGVFSDDDDEVVPRRDVVAR